MTSYEELASHRRAVAALYAGARDTTRTPVERFARFCSERNRLLHEHPQSALSVEQNAVFGGLDYFPYDPSYRFLVSVETLAESDVIQVDLPDDGLLRMRRFGRVSLPIAGHIVRLTLFWMMGYGGGIFLPFCDVTNQSETYGGGRYLLDTIKGADLGNEEGKLVLDFNFAYNPSCAYNSRWVCPLSPAENRIPVEIRAGEKVFAQAQ